MRLTRMHPILMPVVGAAAGLLSALLPSIADADVCATPTLAQCKDPTYYDTTCGADQKAPTSTCSTLLQADFDSQSAGYPVEQRRRPSSMTSVATTLAVQTPAELDTLAFKGKETTSHQPLFETYSTWLTRMALSEIKGIPFQATWSGNGPLVTTCEEFAFDASYDYSRFEQASAQYGSDYRAIFDLAYSPAGIAGHVLADKNGESMGWPVWPGDQQGGVATLPKNTFFTAFSVYDNSLATYTAIGIPSWDPLGGSSVTLADLRSGQNKWSRQDWQWHSLMNSLVGTAGVADDVLYAFDSKKEAFADLLSQRKAAYEQAIIEKSDPTCDWQGGFGFWCCPTDASACRPGALHTVVDLDQQIVAALTEAKQLHCLDDNYFACDWSPRTFVDMLKRQAVRRENDFQSCKIYTGNSFNDARNVTAAMNLGIPPGNYTTTPKRFRSFLSALATSMAAADFPKDPITKKPKLADSASDHGEFGNNDIKAIWSYDVGWKVTGFEGTRALCDAQVDVSGDLNIKGKAYSAVKELFDATAHAWTDSAGGHAMYAIRVRDQALYGGTTTVKLDHAFQIVEHQSFGGDYKVPGPHIVVFGIVIGVNAGISAKFRMDEDLSVFGGRGCAVNAPSEVVIADVHGLIMPAVDSSVFAEVTAGIPWVLEVGIKADLVLVKAAMPITAGAKLRMTRIPAGPFTPASVSVLLDLHNAVKVNMSTLDGSISLFADYFFRHAEKVLFDWNGYATSAVLFNFSMSGIPLAVVKQLQGS